MGKKKILLVAPPVIPTSKDSVAGTEQMIYLLGKGLTEEGHDVSTVARDDSKVYGKLISGGFCNFEFNPKAELDQFYQVMAHTASVVRRHIRDNPDLDAIIDRTCQGLSLYVGHEENGPPVLACLNMPPEYFLAPPFFEYIREKLMQRNDQFVSVSECLAEDYKARLNFKGLESRMNVVHNGIITDDFTFSENHEGYLLYLGRITKDKSPHLAIQAAKDTGNRIVVAGGSIDSKNSDYIDDTYFGEEIRPLLNSSVEWFGPADLQQKVELYGNAKAVIFPSLWSEAFGLVPIEAMACGTPVIAFNRGGPKETIRDGETGFLVEDYAQMVEAVSRVEAIDRSKCRAHVLSNFSYLTCTKNYLKIIDGLGSK